MQGDQLICYILSDIKNLSCYLPLAYEYRVSILIE
jgi:hypothetical protein